jgi:hypothetical protein
MCGIDESPRLLQMARHCQLLTGSFNGNQIPCSCFNANCCQLTKREREHYSQHPTIVETLERQRLAYRRLCDV